MKRLILLFLCYILVNVVFAQSNEQTDPFGNPYADPISNGQINTGESVNNPAKGDYSDYHWSWQTPIVNATPPPPPLPVPIDGGVGLLLLAGLGYGARKMIRK